MEGAKDFDIERELRADTRLENRQNRKQRENAGIAETPSGYARPSLEIAEVRFSSRLYARLCYNSQ